MEAKHTQKAPIMKETKTPDRSVNHYRRYLKILVFVRNFLGIIGVVAGITAIATPLNSFLFWIGFQVFCIAVALLLPLLKLVSVVRSNVHSSEALQAMRDDCDAANALDKWRLEQWLVDWDSPEAQELIRRRIETRKRFLSTHPFTKDKESVALLQALLH